MSMQTGTYTELIFSNEADFSALSGFTSEATLLAGQNRQPTFFPSFFEGGAKARGRAFRITAQGVLSSTGTPTYLFTLRLGPNLLSTSDRVIGITAAITTVNNASNQHWALWADFVCTTPGQGSTNCTIAGAGMIMSPTGFASPLIYDIEPTAPQTATWTATIDGSVQNYLNFTATCSANSGSNTLTCKQLLVAGLN